MVCIGGFLGLGVYVCDWILCVWVVSWRVLCLRGRFWCVVDVRSVSSVD